MTWPWLEGNLNQRPWCCCFSTLVGFYPKHTSHTFSQAHCTLSDLVCALNCSAEVFPRWSTVLIREGVKAENKWWLLSSTLLTDSLMKRTQILYANDIMRVFHTQMHKHRYTWDLMLWSEARRQKFVSANKFDLK